ncbi:MAG: DUF1820 family protein [Acidobacteria bacterium]|nr:DUF1820 family protein [Acidobacteriota bacterium]MCB9397450.1 DUF1820 family protein [Acidobacteriota bacterium]
MYKVHFRLKDTDYELVAESLDLSHPYFVSIKDFVLDYDEGIVVNPHLENTRKRFKGIANIMIPVQSCSLIEQVPAKSGKTKSNVTVIPGSPQDAQGSD